MLKFCWNCSAKQKFMAYNTIISQSNTFWFPSFFNLKKSKKGRLILILNLIIQLIYWGWFLFDLFASIPISSIMNINILYGMLIQYKSIGILIMLTLLLIHNIIQHHIGLIYFVGLRKIIHSTGFTEIARVLKPGGYFLATIPLSENLNLVSKSGSKWFFRNKSVNLKSCIIGSFRRR